MSRHRDRSEMRNIATIDVTPLVDLTFLLLIVFMITAPVLERAVDVTPPSMDAQQVEDVPHRVINLTRAGDILLDEQPVSRDTLAAELKRLRVTEPELAYFIRADESRPYGEVMSIMKIARAADIQNVSLVTLPESP